MDGVEARKNDGGEGSRCNANACIRSQGLGSRLTCHRAVGKWKTMMMELGDDARPRVSAVGSAPQNNLRKDSFAILRNCRPLPSREGHCDFACDQQDRRKTEADQHWWRWAT